MYIKYLFISGLFLLSLITEAHGPVRQKLQEEVTINVSAIKVWQAIKKFSDLSWHPGVQEVVIIKEKDNNIKEKDNKKGIMRSIILKDGNIINEKLKKYQPNKMRYTYKIVDMSTVKTIKYLGDDIAVKVLPVSNYSASIQVNKKDNNKSVVIWKAAYYRGFMNNNPPKELTEKVAKTVVSSVFRAGLDNLKILLEGKTGNEKNK